MRMTFRMIAMVAAMAGTCSLATAMSPVVPAPNHVTIVAVNDTHSQIEPASDGQGGVLRRRAIYDHYRALNPGKTVVVHAGDAVQGTVFFSLYEGEVEYALMDSLGYDMVILGNHEFDNGLESLAKYYKNVHATRLSANYDMSGTPLEGMFQPYRIMRFGDKKVGFFGINITPKGLIGEKNYEGMHYLLSSDVADATAKYLKDVQKVDYTVMISHIGYDSYDPTEPNDTTIIRNSHYIDMVVGAHSHTVIKPGSEYAVIPNADGKPIVVGQNGKSGKLVSVYNINLDNGQVNYEHVAVNSDWDEPARKYVAMNRWLDHYRAGVDSLMNNPLCQSDMEWKNGSDASQNWVCDVTLDIIKGVSGIKNIDLAIMNKGGIRTSMPRGTVTEGLLMSMFPFDNRYVVLDISGADLLEALNVMAGRGGDALSRGMAVVFNKDGKVTSAKLNGKKIDPKKRYKVATINYLSGGGDYMVPLTRAKVLFTDEVKYGDHIISYARAMGAAGKKLTTSDEARMVKK